MQHRIMNKIPHIIHLMCILYHLRIFIHLQLLTCSNSTPHTPSPSTYTQATVCVPMNIPEENITMQNTQILQFSTEQKGKIVEGGS